MPPYVMEWQIKTTVLSAQSDLTIVVGPEWRESKRNVARPKPSHLQCNMAAAEETIFFIKPSWSNGYLSGLSHSRPRFDPPTSLYFLLISNRDKKVKSHR